MSDAWSRGTTRLVVPDVRWHPSWAEMLREFGDDFPHGSGLEAGAPQLDRAGCEAFVRARRAYADRTRPVPEGRVHCDYLWIADDDALVGFLALRHELNAGLLEEGGHIGYSVRPTRRREGHAARALAASLPRARGLGLDRVLVTCDAGNVGSRRTIEGGGGVLEDVRGGRQRYWIPTPA